MAPPRVSLAILLAALAVVGGGSTCSLVARDAPNALETIAVDGLGFEIFLALLAFAGAVLAPGDPLDRLGLRRGHLSRGQNLALILGTLAASAALDGVLDLTGLGQHSALWEFEQAVSGVRGRALLVSLVAFVIAPGVCEELFCRGLLQRGLVSRFGAPSGILVAASIFGALHLDPIHAVFAACLGVYLGAVCHLAGSVRPAIACHVANNLVALLTTAYLPTAGGDGLLRVVLGATTAAAALWWVWHRAGGSPPAIPDGAKPGPFQHDPPLNRP